MKQILYYDNNGSLTLKNFESIKMANGGLLIRDSFNEETFISADISVDTFRRKATLINLSVLDITPMQSQFTDASGFDKMLDAAVIQ